jgi:hypothetical protein
MTMEEAMSNHTHLSRFVAAGMAIVAVGLPAAAHADVIAVAGPPAGGGPAIARPAAAAIRPLSSQTGFVWGDAGIGAGGAVVLIAGCAGGAAVMRRRWTIGSA